MHIVLEGPDNAGKSTLATKLSERLNLTIQHSGGPSKYKGEVNERADSYNADTDPKIFDRHPCVSQNIYVCALGTGGELVTAERVKEFYDNKPLIIYCRNNGSLDGHQQSEHSSEEYFNKVEKNYEALCELYDHWGVRHAHMIYRIGDDVNQLVKAIKGAIA